MNVKQSPDAVSKAVPIAMPAHVRELVEDNLSSLVAASALPKDGLPRPARQSGWVARLAGIPGRALSALLRPRLDTRALSAHLRRDVGLVDSIPVKKHP